MLPYLHLAKHNGEMLETPKENHNRLDYTRLDSTIFTSDAEKSAQPS